MPSLVIGLVVCLVFGGLPQLAERATADLDEGVRQVRGGDFEASLLTLDRAVRQLKAEGGSEKDLGRGYLHLGVAYLGLGQEPLARAKFREALRHDADMSPSSEEFSAKVIRVFAAARKEEAATTRLRQEAGKSWKHGGALILAGGAAAGAGATLATVVRERKNQPPATPTIAVTPDGQPLFGATTVTFLGSATDQEGDALQYDWDFGDGSRGSGASITHRYARPAQFGVTLTVSDGLASAQTMTSITVGTLAGTWRTNVAPFGAVEYSLRPNATTGQTLNASYVFASGLTIPDSHGLIDHPRRVLLIYSDLPQLGGVGECLFVFTGEADASLQTITGMLTAQPGSGRPCPFNGQSYALSLRR